MTEEQRKLCKSLNLAIAKAKKLRGDMPEDLFTHLFGVSRNLSLGLCSEPDIADAKKFIEALDQFYEMNRETYERIDQEHSRTVESSKESSKPSAIE